MPLASNRIAIEKPLFERRAVVRADGPDREYFIAAPGQEHRFTQRMPSSIVPSGIVASSTPWVRSGPLSFTFSSLIWISSRLSCRPTPAAALNRAAYYWKHLPSPHSASLDPPDAVVRPAVLARTAATVVDPTRVILSLVTVCNRAGAASDSRSFDAADPRRETATVDLRDPVGGSDELLDPAGATDGLTFGWRAAPPIDNDAV